MGKVNFIDFRNVKLFTLFGPKSVTISPGQQCNNDTSYKIQYNFNPTDTRKGNTPCTAATRSLLCVMLGQAFVGYGLG